MENLKTKILKQNIKQPKLQETRKKPATAGKKNAL